MISGKEFPDAGGSTAYKHTNEALKIAIDKLVEDLDAQHFPTTSTKLSMLIKSYKKGKNIMF